MKPEIIDLIENARKRKGDKFKNQLFVFGICLVLSIFLWTLVELSQNYLYAIEYRLTYTEIPGNLKLVRYSDSTLTVKIKLQGFELFWERFFKSGNREFEVSLRNVKVRTSEGIPHGYMLTNRLGKEIAALSNVPSDIYIVTPDTLFFEFEKQVLRRTTARQATGVVNTSNHAADSMSTVKPIKRIDSLQGQSKKRR